MKQATIAVNGIDLHYRAQGAADAPLLVFLHGFPEYSGAWDGVLPAFAGRYHAVAPDQRGYDRSSKPAGVEAYRISHLVRDILGLADRLAPGQPFGVVAHDWGASVAYALAIARPDRVSRLAVINGVHPGPFQRSLIEDDAQRQASSYIHYLRSDKAEEGLARNSHEKLLRMMTGFGAHPWMTPEQKTGYLESWKSAGSLTGMLNWYRATPIVVPHPGETVDRTKIPDLDQSRLRIRMPHLVLWGMEDMALLPSARAGLDAYCEDVTVREIADADHWVVHQRTAEVIGHLAEFFTP